MEYGNLVTSCLFFRTIYRVYISGLYFKIKLNFCLLFALELQLCHSSCSAIFSISLVAGKAGGANCSSSSKPSLARPTLSRKHQTQTFNKTLFHSLTVRFFIDHMLRTINYELVGSFLENFYLWRKCLAKLNLCVPTSGNTLRSHQTQIWVICDF